MKEWLVTHIDAVIPIVGGLCLVLTGIFKRRSGSVEDTKKQQKLRLWGTILITIGIFRIFTGSLPTTPPTPVTATTDDGKASVVFPQEPVRTEAVDEAPGVKIHRVTRACNFKGIDLRLSYNDYVPGAKDAPKDVLLANVKEYLTQQGFILERSSEHPGPVHELVMDKPDVGARQVMRIWFGPEGMYRAMATTEKGYHDDPRVLAFIPSFRITTASPEK
jgi:hypothetical protein